MVLGCFFFDAIIINAVKRILIYWNEESMAISFTRKTYTDSASSGSSLTASDLNKIESAIASLADSVNVLRKAAFVRTFLYSNANGTSNSVTLTASANQYSYIEIKITNSQGNIGYVKTVPDKVTYFTSHGVTSNTTWVTFGTVYCNGTNARITSQINMPITAYKWESGAWNIDSYITEVIGYKTLE